MGFQAQDAVVALDWDLRPFVDAHGTAPEPSQAKLDAYVKSMFGIIDQLNLDPSTMTSEADIRSALIESLVKDRSAEEAEAEADKLAATVLKARIRAASKVCGGSPTMGELEKLARSAPRVFDAFTGWVQGWAMPSDPTMPDTTPSPARQNGAAPVT